MELKGPQTPVRQNATVTLVCNVHQAKPAANITWYNGSIPLDRRETEINDEVFPSPRVWTFFFFFSIYKNDAIFES